MTDQFPLRFSDENKLITLNSIGNNGHDQKTLRVNRHLHFESFLSLSLSLSAFPHPLLACSCTFKH